MGANKPLSEYMCLILEPVAKWMEVMEINTSSGLLSVVESLNEDLYTHTDDIEKNDNKRGEKNIILETIDEEMERISSLGEDEKVKNHLGEQSIPRETNHQEGGCPR